MRRIFAFIAVLLLSLPAHAQDVSERAAKPYRIGLLASTTGIAANYGKAVLEGAQLALAELTERGIRAEIIVEDDQSLPRQTAAAWQKLRSADKVQAMIGGTWWANSIVRAVDIPFISCETLYNKEFVLAPNYFSLAGDLRDWISVFEPLVKERRWERGAMVRFVSGFAETLNEEFTRMFSRDGRIFLGALQYSEIQMQEAASLAARVKALSPDVLYFDGQPSSFASFMHKLAELHVSNVAVLTNPIAEDAYNQKSFDPGTFGGEVYYSQRQQLSPSFEAAFKARYGRPPVLHADLGYYALYIIAWALNQPSNAVDAIRSGHTVDNVAFVFDDHNVFRGEIQRIYTFKDRRPRPVN